MRENTFFRKIIVLSVITTFTMIANAHESTLSFNTPYSLLNKYLSNNYLATYQKLSGEIAASQSDKNYHVTDAEVEYLKIKTAYLSGDADAKNKIKRYLNYETDPLFTPRANILLGNIYINEGNFDEAEKCYIEINPEILTTSERDELRINRGLILLNKKEFAKAEEELSKINTQKSEYRTPAIFYKACANYAQEEYKEAEEGFLISKGDDTFALSSNYYLTNIYFANKRYNSALSIGESLLTNRMPESYKNNLLKICGESAFALGNIEKTIEYLGNYVQNSPDDQQAAYTLGVAYYNTKQHAEAIKTLSTLTATENNFSQSAYLYLGHSYLLMNDKNGAMFAYEKAMAYDSDIQAKESAMFNYCLLIDESNILDFDKKIRVFESYINQFSKEENAKTINQLLAISYLTTNNYEAALTSVEKIKNPSKELLEAKQIILYNLGIKEFAKEEYNKAKTNFTKSINTGNYNIGIKAKAYLWRGETNYIFKEYNAAESDFKQYIKLSKQPNPEVYYSLGYTLFITQRYNEANSEFDNFINRGNDNKQLKADALNRKGDCLYMMRQYNNAYNTYIEAEKTHNLTADYSIYMQGVTLGIEKRHKDKVNTMQRIATIYPTSKYASQALEQKGIAELALDEKDNALATFAQLYTKYPKTREARSALLQSAIVYMNIGDNSKALSAYKTIIEEYPGSDEAKTALEDLKNYHVQQGNIKPYADYIKKIKGENVYDASEMDSATYLAAENAFLRTPGEKSIAQMKEYINNYPNGAFNANALNYIGLYAFNNNNFEEARKYMEEVLLSKNVELRENSLKTLATIEEEDKNYEKALIYYKNLSNDYPTLISGKEAKSSIVRVLKLSNRNDEVVDEATKILSEGNNDIINFDEIRYYRATALEEIGDKEKATADWEALANNSQSIYSAEAKYMIAKGLYDNNKLSEAEAKINDILSNSSSSKYWVARGIILLSDISAKQGDNFKAKQYLISLKNNYNDSDDIKSTIETKLTKYEK